MATNQVEEILEQLPDVSEFPTNFTIKSTNEILKQAIIDANPQFSSLNWDDFQFNTHSIGSSAVDESNGINPEYLHSFTLNLKENPDRKKYYRNQNPYSFKFKPLDARPLYQALFGPLFNKTFKYDLQNQLEQLMSRIPYGTDRMGSAFSYCQISDTESYYFFNFSQINANQRYTSLFVTDIYHNSRPELRDYLDNRSNSKEEIKRKLELFKKNFAYIRFVADAVAEEDMISTPEQPTQPNLTINPSNVYTVS